MMQLSSTWNAFQNLTKFQLAPFSRKPHDACSTHGASDEADVSHGIKMVPCSCIIPFSFTWQTRKSIERHRHKTRETKDLREGGRQGSCYSLAESSELHADNSMVDDHWMYMNCCCIIIKMTR